ncbi:DJ-1/PfpI family protein [Bradyrhizobium tropiciagri]|uniref:DJ-1/PfpI family protein n=1 Tax=Bradyrhizobium tropiciagri TaxID=312253 RepID=UPI001BA9D106|nr:DJ-1/PfpI family protein [Bradyrhizobium tropiciagri]MBR0896763.1 DJ-1/PfpI family protein [Bradyrhizobium tropiciagri]
MKIACFLYPDFTTIDLVGPLSPWSHIPGVELEFVAANKGPMATDSRLSVLATHSLDSFTPNPDVIFVPGAGRPTFDAMQNDAFLDAIARAGAQAKWITSVCTGSLILGAAGLLEGYRAACHWYARPYLEKFGAIPDDRRVVIDRNRASGGGVTAGIDFGLRMAAEWVGEDTARLIELIMEYAPEPPFNTGRPELVDAQTLSIAKQMAAQIMPEELATIAAKRRGLLHLGA